MLKIIHIGPTRWFEVLAIEEVARAKRDEKTEKDKKSWWSPHLQLWADWRVRSEDVKIAKVKVKPRFLKCHNCKIAASYTCSHSWIEVKFA